MEENADNQDHILHTMPSLSCLFTEYLLLLLPPRHGRATHGREMQGVNHPTP